MRTDNIRLRRDDCEDSRRRTGCLILCAVIALLRGVFYWLTPCQLDDWQFVSVYRDYNGGGDSFNLNAWLSYMLELRNNDNSRIPNLLSPASTLWAPWKVLFPWVNGILVAFIVWLSTVLALGRKAKWDSVGLMWLLITLFLPWRDSLAVRDYSLNYVWGGAVTLAVVVVIMKSVNGLMGVLKMSAGLVLCVVAGGWHEGFVLPALAGLGMVMLLRKGRMGRRWWLLTAIYAISGAIMTLSPGTLSRAGMELSEGASPRLYLLVVDLFPSGLLIVSTVGFLLFRKGRAFVGDLCKGWIFPLFVTAAIAGACFPFLLKYTPRVCFCSCLCAVIALGKLYSPVWKASGAKVRAVVGGLAVLFCVAHGIYVCCWQSRYNDEYEEIYKTWMHNGGGTVYKDVISPDAPGVFSLYFPSRLMWITPFNYNCLKNAHSDWRHICVVPEALVGSSADNLIPVKGNGRIGLYRNILVGDPASRADWDPSGGDCIMRRPFSADIVLKDSSRVFLPGVPMLYYIGEKGDTMLYIPTRGVDPSQIAEININGF